MKWIIVVFASLLFLLDQNSFGQTINNRIKFKYRLKEKDFQNLQDKNLAIKDDSGKGRPMKLCFNLRVFNCLINNKEGVLTIDPWTIETGAIQNFARVV